MDIERIYKQLSGLRDHCECMIDEEDADKQVWKDDRDALDAVIKDIEAKGLNINHSKNGGINTMSKTKVTVTATDGTVQKFEGDSIILFTVSAAEEFLRGRAKMMDADAAYIGEEIPEPLFADTVGALVAGFIDSRHNGHPTLAAFNLFCVRRVLKAYEQRLTKETTQEQKRADFEKSIDDLFNAILKR